MASKTKSRKVSMDLEWIKEGLAEPGKSQRGLAEYLHVDPSVISKIVSGKRQLKAAEVEKIAEYLSSEVVHSYQPAGGSMVKSTSPSRGTLPILGGAVGGTEGLFMDNGQALGYTPTPGQLEGVEGAYAVYMFGESMLDRFQPGEILQINPVKPIAQGNDVCVTLQGDAGDMEYIIKRYISRSAKRIKLLQLNPRRELEFPVDRIVSIHRIVGIATDG